MLAQAQAQTSRSVQKHVRVHTVREVPNAVKIILACPCNWHPHPAHFRIREYYFQKMNYNSSV